MPHYSHRQPGTMLLAACLAGAAVCLALAAITPNGAFLALAAFVLIGTAIVFSSLTIEIDETQLAWHFGPGLIRKSVALADIEYAAATQVRWTGGCGIHRTANGWLYNVAGRGAVLVRLKNTRQFLLGSDEPERLDTALRSAVERLHNP
ncbi:MAG TPA: hypothetical protein VFK51_01130 [Burkholderiales bacterium]|nr:hypothetical protein [Burkholderiales bacterium]